MQMSELIFDVNSARSQLPRPLSNDPNANLIFQFPQLA